MFNPWLKNILLLALVAASFPTACSPERDRAVGVKLLPEKEISSPNETFELRFDEPMIVAEKIGAPVAVSPLAIRPALAGQFAWLSDRSGVFTPSEPTVLGQVYHFSLLPGLRNAAGRPVTAQLYRRLATPPLKAAHGWVPQASTNAAASQVIRLHFNAAVDVCCVADYIEFRNAAGRRQAAKITAPLASGAAQANSESPMEFQPTFDPRDRKWSELFESRPIPAVIRQPGAPRPAQQKRVTRDNILFVSPREPLAEGDGWRLVLRRGLPGAGVPAKLAEDFVVKIGDVRPLTVTEISAHNRLTRGRTADIHFSKPLAPSINDTNVLDSISIEPEPKNLSARRTGDRVQLTADFALDREYSITVASGLESFDGHKLKAAKSATLHFEPMPPRLYFKIFREDQLAAGRRELELMTVNVPSIRLRARQLDRHTLIHALRGYHSYLADDRQFQFNEFYRRGEWEDGAEPYREVDFNSVPGKVIFERSFSEKAEIDDPHIRKWSWDDIVGKKGKGAVFIAAELAPPAGHTRARVGTQALVQLTDIGLVWKRGRGETLVHAFSLATGQPLEGATIRALNNDNEVLEEQTTDAQGLATLGDTEKRLWLMAEKDGDLHALSMDGYQHEFSVWGFRLPTETTDDSRARRRVLLFSDRPVYRPGETFHLKGIIRTLAENGLRVPKTAKLHLALYDPRNNPFFETNLVASALGSFNASVALPPNSVGPHRAEVTIGRDSANVLAFEVQEFEPAAFEISLGTRANYTATDSIEIPIRAQYYLGKPLARATARWTLRANDTPFTPPGFDDFRFCNNVEHFRDDRLQRDGGITLQGAETLSPRGEILLKPALTLNPFAPQPRAASLHVEVTDANQQTISAAANFVRHSSEFYLGLRELRGVMHSGEKIPVEVIAVRPDGQPGAPGVKARATLTRIEWRTVRVEGAGGTHSYRSEIERKEIAARDIATRSLTRRGDHWETAAGEAVDAFKVSEPGVYLLEVSAKDAAGQAVLTAVSFSVAGPRPLAWNYRNELQIDLVPDRKSYRVGDTAEVLVKTPISGAALVTIERERVRRSYVTNLVGNAPLIAVPILDGDAPNIFVSVVMTRGLEASRRQVRQPEHRFGVCHLAVEAPSTRLKVSVSMPEKNYEPGQPVRVTATVKDFSGKAQRGAEVTLYAVDEGVLSLMGGKAPEPHAFFHALHPLGVRTFAGITTLLAEDQSELGLFNKGYLIGGGGDGHDRVRKDFPACPLWLAALVTDAEGQVTASFDAPDALTRYRIIAVAHANRDRFGHGESAVQINKPLMLQPSPPRFANVGDKIFARAVVLNNSEQAGEIEVTLALDATATTGERARKISIAARGSAMLDFPIEFRETGEARWIWSTRFASDAPGKFRDRVQSTFTVRHPAPLLREVHFGAFSNSMPNLLASADPQLLGGAGTLTLRVSNTRLSELDWAAEHLLHYPYGCVEQTTSSLIPWLVLRDLTNVLAQLPKSPMNFRAAIERGVSRLFSMQTPSGGLSYWPGHGEPMLWGSAYGGLALAMAKQRGQSLPARDFERLIEYLRTSLRDEGTGRGGAFNEEKILACYALAVARHAEPAYHELLFGQRAKISAESRALLALAILESNGNREMARELLAMSADEKSPAGDWFGVASRATALRLIAWSRLEPAGADVPRLVNELLGGRKAVHWITTQGNAWALLALTEYARRVEGATKAASGNFTWGAANVPFELAEKPAAFQHVLPIPRDAGALPLKLDNAGRAPLYTQLQLEARAPRIEQPRQDRGFSIRRSYQRLDEKDELTDLKNLRVGDRVVVTLEIETRTAASYVAIDDALPALFEALHPEFKTQQTSVQVASNWWSDHQELRADRALFFRDHLEPGTHVIRYLARVRAAGTATAPSTRAEEMYQPDRHGVSETQTITALPLE